MIRIDRRTFTIGLAAAGLLAVDFAHAQYQRIVGGLSISLGIVEARKLAGYAEERVHGAKFDANAHHLLISVSDAKTGAHLQPASVVVEVTDPKGRVQRKPLKPSVTAGAPDYSEVFELGWAGDYRIDVAVEPAAGARLVKTRFNWKHHV